MDIETERVGMTNAPELQLSIQDWQRIRLRHMLLREAGALVSGILRAGRVDFRT